MREITPIGNGDFFIVLNQNNFKFPLHYHSEYELNIVRHFKGVRIIGDSVETVDGPDMVFIGPDIRHAWHGKSVYEGEHVMITIQFREQLFSESFMDKNLFRPIKELMTLSSKGVSFPAETIDAMIPRFIALLEKKNFDSVLDFFSILNDLATSSRKQTLCSTSQNDGLIETKSRRVKMVYQYLQENYHRKITVSEIASLVSMTETGFCHFFKKRTHKSFSDFLSDLRIGEASRQLLDTSKTIREIAYDCGFNNISNFNRIFKKKKGVNPSEYRIINLNTMILY